MTFIADDKPANVVTYVFLWPACQFIHLAGNVATEWLRFRNDDADTRHANNDTSTRKSCCMCIMGIIHDFQNQRFPTEKFFNSCIVRQSRQKVFFFLLIFPTTWTIWKNICLNSCTWNVKVCVCKHAICPRKILFGIY